MDRRRLENAVLSARRGVLSLVVFAACSSGGDRESQADGGSGVSSIDPGGSSGSSGSSGAGGSSSGLTEGSGSGGATESGGSGTSGATGSSSEAATSPAQTDTGPGTSSSGGPGDTSSSTSTGELDPCPCPDLDVPLDDGIFVLSKTAALWKYLPKTNELVQLGALDCGVAPSTFSMGVDRQGYAWVQFSDLQIRKVDVTDVSACSDPGFVPGQGGLKNFGMAFVSNSAVDKCDRIYGNHYNGVAEGDMVAEFFSVDPETLAVVQLGKSDYGLAELTGTGDGRAFLFAGPDPSRLIEVDKATGATLEVIPLPGVKTGGGFAFAFFAGDFYFFTDKQSDGKSEVTRIDYDDSDENGLQDLVVVLEDAPLRIVGAGVSTCAPVIPQ